ncbi:MAG: DUF302 domain-containing protein [Acidobacteria bacterium]|nr:DUF302 domain-containing protein [Acidobacteriota bacterium]
MTTVEYGFEKQLSGVSLAEARKRVTSALAAEGFGILTEIDVSATLKKKLDVDFRPYVILGACNPTLAHQALQGDPHIGLLLPCNVVVQEVSGGTSVSIASPRVMFSVVQRDDLEPTVTEAETRLRRVLDTLG